MMSEAVNVFCFLLQSSNFWEKWRDGILYLPTSKMLILAKGRQDSGINFVQFYFPCFIFRILTSHTVAKIWSFTVFWIKRNNFSENLKMLGRGCFDADSLKVVPKLSWFFGFRLCTFSMDFHEFFMDYNSLLPLEFQVQMEWCPWTCYEPCATDSIHRLQAGIWHCTKAASLFRSEAKLHGKSWFLILVSTHLPFC